MSSWFKAGTGCSVDGSVLSKPEQGNNWRTAYGIQEVTAGKHEWKVKIIKCNIDVMIGITSNTKYYDSYPWSKNDTFCYVYYSNNGDKLDKSGQSKYSQAFSDGDIITVHVDLDGNTIEFSKNGTRLGIAYTNVQSNQKYRLTACVNKQGTKMDMISYINLSEEQKEDISAKDTSNYIEQYNTLVTKQCNYLKDNFIDNKVKQFNVAELTNATKYLSKLSNDMKKLETELKKCQTQFIQAQSTVAQYTKLDASNYKNWSMKQVEIWLNTLENGRYQKYACGLIKGFQKDQVSAADLPDLDGGDLKLFGIGVFGDRRDLKKQLQKLKQGNEGANTYI